MARPVVIGLSGGIASGKSTVARMFRQLGAVVLDADLIAHDILNDPEIKRQVGETWGKGVIVDGRVDRRSLAGIVFDPDNGPQQLARLENITHPAIDRRIRKQLKELSTSNAIAVVLDVPLLFETEWHRLADKLVYVDTKKSVRIGRAVERGWSEQEFHERERRQKPLDEKRERSPDVVENSGGTREVFAQVKKIWKSWGLPLPDESTASDFLER